MFTRSQKKFQFFKNLMAMPNYILNFGSDGVFRFFVSTILPILECAFDRRKVKSVFLLSVIEHCFVVFHNVISIKLYIVIHAHPPHETMLNHSQQKYRFHLSPIECTF